MKKVVKIFSRSLTVLGITLGFIFLTLVIMIKMICSNISGSAKELFATTMLETGQLKFVTKLFLSKDEIQKLVDQNSMATMNTEMDTDLINTENKEDDFDINGIQLEEISGNTFFAKMLIINDPSRIKLATTYPWSEYGVELEKLVKDNNAIAGINGGLYLSTGNKGGRPLGVVVKNGKIEYNQPTGYPGLHIIGFDETHILRIINIEGKNASQVEQIIKEEKMIDAVTFQEESSDANNHFVKLIINGEERGVDGKGSGANPRTAIGQRADGSVLLLVTDGRGANGHLGATAKDLIKIMKKYGAVNAANLDGGSSSSMYYNDKYEMTSVTFYYANSSWKLPTGFIVEKRD
ncbi:MAG: phosphodiester glycosidase family protein [Bacilli bacterium]|jgi:exopolysaccharide biosynthesis protein|nr:phosphodiester glycosidase family protein [Bacilli bacterium]